MYSAASELTLSQQFGVVSKDEYYENKYERVKHLLSNTVTLGRRSCSTLNGINKNKSQQRTTIYASGSVLCDWDTYADGTPDAFIYGIKYLSRGYSIDYYNQNIVPIKVTSSIDSTSTSPVHNSIIDTNGDGGYTKKAFTTSIYSVTYHDYMYFGEDPLVNEIDVETTM